MSSTGSDIQSTVILHLRGSAALRAYVVDRIFDEIPHAQENIDSTFPRVRVDDASETEHGADDVDMSEFRINVHVDSRYPGKKEAQEIMHIVRQCVVGGQARNQHRSEVGKIVNLLFDFADGPRREADGKTYHGVIRFRGHIQY